MSPRERAMRDAAKLSRSKKGPATRKERRKAAIKNTTVTDLRKKKADRKAAKAKTRKAAPKKAAPKRTTTTGNQGPMRPNAKRTSGGSSSGYSRWKKRYSR